MLVGSWVRKHSHGKQARVRQLEDRNSDGIKKYQELKACNGLVVIFPDMFPEFRQFLPKL
jgi:hypothetical protein